MVNLQSKRAKFVLLLLFIFLAACAYSRILHSFFLSDEFAQIGKVIRGDFSVTWGGEHLSFFRPLFILSYVVDAAVWGRNSFGYHLTNAVLHGVNSYLVFVLAVRFFQRANLASTQSIPLAVAAGLIFLVHPSHTEAVTWISGRADLIATLFTLSSLVAYDTYARRNSNISLGLSLVLFFFALLAKESALCVPLIVVVMEIWSTGNATLKRLAKPIISFSAVLLVYFLIRYAALGTVIGVYGASQHLNFKVSLLWDRLPKYVLRSLLPPLPEQLSSVLINPLKSLAFILFALIVIAAITALLVLRRKWRTDQVRREQNMFFFLLLILFLSSLLPVIAMGISLFDSAGERFVYLPSVFSSIAVAYIAGISVSNNKVRLVLLGCLLGFYAVSLQVRNQPWRNASVLSRSILDQLTESARQDRVVVVNVPDSLDGAPVFRNGLEEALRTFQTAKKNSQVEIVSYHNLQSLSDGISIERHSKSLRLHLLNPKSEFARVNKNIECMDVEVSKQSLAIRFDDCASGINIFFFRDGKMNSIDELTEER